MTNTFNSMMAEAKTQISNGKVDVSVTRETPLGTVKMYAFRAGGMVRPGDFRCRFWINGGDRLNKDQARAALAGV
jgi:hypothetical protein